MSIPIRLIPVLIISLISQNAYSQTKVDTVVVHYQTKNFDVAIFPSQLHPSDVMKGKSFTPGKAEIDSAEIALKRDIKTLDSQSPTRLVSYNLKKYRRQYFGYVDSATRHRMLYINCFWKSFKYRQDWLKEVVNISEGGGYYYTIKFDLATKKLFDFWVHGRE